MPSIPQSEFDALTRQRSNWKLNRLSAISAQLTLATAHAIDLASRFEREGDFDCADIADRWLYALAAKRVQLRTLEYILNQRNRQKNLARMHGRSK